MTVKVESKNKKNKSNNNPNPSADDVAVKLGLLPLIRMEGTGDNDVDHPKVLFRLLSAKALKEHSTGRGSGGSGGGDGGGEGDRACVVDNDGNPMMTFLRKQAMSLYLLQNLNSANCIRDRLEHSNWNNNTDDSQDVVDPKHVPELNQPTIRFTYHDKQGDQILILTDQDVRLARKEYAKDGKVKVWASFLPELNGEFTMPTAKCTCTFTAGRSEKRTVSATRATGVSTKSDESEDPLEKKMKMTTRQVHTSGPMEAVVATVVELVAQGLVATADVLSTSSNKTEEGLTGIRLSKQSGTSVAENDKNFNKMGSADVKEPSNYDPVQQPKSPISEIVLPLTSTAVEDAVASAIGLVAQSLVFTADLLAPLATKPLPVSRDTRHPQDNDVPGHVKPQVSSPRDVMPDMVNPPVCVGPVPPEHDAVPQRSHRCAACMTFPLVGRRFHAVNIPNYDLCELCYQKYWDSNVAFEMVEADAGRDCSFQDHIRRRYKNTGILWAPPRATAVAGGRCGNLMMNFPDPKSEILRHGHTPDGIINATMDEKVAPSMCQMGSMRCVPSVSGAAGDGRDALHVKSTSNSPVHAADDTSSDREKETEASSIPFIHGRHSCDFCLCCPIIGRRFRATNRLDYDLCERCYSHSQLKDMQFTEVELDADGSFQLEWRKKFLKTDRKSSNHSGSHVDGKETGCTGVSTSTATTTADSRINQDVASDGSAENPSSFGSIESGPNISRSPVDYKPELPKEPSVDDPSLDTPNTSKDHRINISDTSMEGETEERLASDSSSTSRHTGSTKPSCTCSTDRSAFSNPMHGDRIASSNGSSDRYFAYRGDGISHAGVAVGKTFDRVAEAIKAMNKGTTSPLSHKFCDAPTPSIPVVKVTACENDERARASAPSEDAGKRLQPGIQLANDEALARAARVIGSRLFDMYIPEQYSGLPHGFGQYDAIPVGTTVSFRDLVNCPERNGNGGVIEEFDSISGRYTIAIGDSNERVRAKPSNLLQHARVQLRSMDDEPELNGEVGIVIASMLESEQYKVYLPDKADVVTVGMANIILAEGTVVRISGIIQKRHLNGAHATIRGWIAESERYLVQVSPSQMVRVPCGKVEL